MVKYLRIVLLAMLLVVIAVYAHPKFTLYYPMKGTISATEQIKVYKDSGLTQELANSTTIDWGALGIGANLKTYWIKNIGNCNVTLTLRNTGLPAGWTLTWNYTGLPLQLSQVATVKITLTVPSSPLQGTYSWNSWIDAEAFL